MPFADEFNSAFFGTRSDEEITVIGTVKNVTSGYYEVALNDSDTTTRCGRTVTARVGDRVMCRIRSGIVTIIGNLTNPSADSVTVVQHDVFINDLGANNITAQNINAVTATIQTLGVDDLVANQAYIKDLTAKNITTDNIEAASAFVADLQANNIDTSNIVADHAKVGQLDAAEISAALVTVGSLNANYAHITNGTIDNANIDVAKVNNLETTVASIADAQIGKATIDAAKITNLDATVATLTQAAIGSATIKQAQVENLSADYARIDRTNIDEAWVKDLMIQGGMVAQDGTFFKLTGLHLDAGDITAGTLTVDHLAVQGEDGEYYLLSPNEDGTFTNAKLDGSIIEKDSLNADRITANSITAEQLTVNDVAGTGGWINFANGTFEYSNADTGAFIIWDGEHLSMNVDNLTINSTAIVTHDDLSAVSSQVDSISSEIDGKLEELAGEMQQLGDGSDTIRKDLEQSIKDLSDSVSSTISNVGDYMQFDATGLTIGKAGSSTTVRVSDERVSFTDGGSEVAYINGNMLYIANEQVLQNLRFGDFVFFERTGTNYAMNIVESANTDVGVWTADPGTVSISSGVVTAKVTNTSGNSRIYCATPMWENGATYYYEFMAKAASPITIRPSRSLIDFGSTHEITTSWNKYSGYIYSRATVTGGTLSFQVNAPNVEFQMKEIKLSKGTAKIPYSSNAHNMGLKWVTK